MKPEPSAWAMERAERLYDSIVGDSDDPKPEDVEQIEIRDLARILDSIRRKAREEGRIAGLDEAARVVESRARSLPRGEPKFHVAAAAITIRAMTVSDPARK